MKTLADRYRFFRQHAGGIVGYGAVYPIELARAEERAEREGLECTWEDEWEAWDYDGGPPPKHVLFASVRDDTRNINESLGIIGLDSDCDPYMRVIAAELFCDAFETLDERAEKEAAAFVQRSRARALSMLIEMAYTSTGCP